MHQPIHGAGSHTHQRAFGGGYTTICGDTDFTTAQLPRGHSDHCPSTSSAAPLISSP